MIPTYPKCSNGHPLTIMRLELHEGCYPMYRCPECWKYEPMFEVEDIDRLAMRNQYAIIVDDEILRNIVGQTHTIERVVYVDGRVVELVVTSDPK